VWGPIGGGEPFPWRYALETSFVNWIFEGGRSVSSVAASFAPSVVSAVRKVDVIIVTNRQTEKKLRSLGRIKPIFRQPMVITRRRFDAIRKEATTKSQGVFKIISGGSVEGRKGFALTIKALSKLKHRGIHADFTITGHGMELPKLRDLARKCGVDDRVHFEHGLDDTAYIRKLAESHIFCFPSLRDNSPVTLLEAMAAECVPIVLNNGGPSETVDSSCGFVLPLESPEQTVGRIADAIAQMSCDKTHRLALALAAQIKVENNYLDDRISDVMSDAYNTAMKLRSQSDLL
jgi:glycosyltransferase involved in cell wall biosynthesis